MKLIYSIITLTLSISTPCLAQDSAEIIPSEVSMPGSPVYVPEPIDPAVVEVTQDHTQNDNPPGIYSQDEGSLPPVVVPEATKLVIQSPQPIEVISPPKRFRFLGLQGDVGVPDGVALGLIVRPKLNWLRLNAGATWNYLSYGVRGGLTLDPINFGIAPTLTAEVGHFFYGKIPSEQVEISYDYLNLHGGLEFGKRDVIRFFIHGGVSYMNINTKNFSTLFNHSDSVSLSDPTFSVRVAPSLKLGIFYLF